MTVRHPPRIRRSLLITPGDRPERIAKSAGLPADGIVLDLEDGVGPEQKPAAREAIAKALATLDFGHRERLVRVNAVGTADYAADLATLDVARLDALFVPKVESADQLRTLAAWLDAAEQRATQRAHPVEIVATIETPRGLLRALEIADATTRTTALFFGSGDYTAATGSAVTERALAVPRALVVAAAATVRIEAIDAAWFVSVKDVAATRVDAMIARELGFAGKLVFHPDQIAVANEVFTPTAAEVARAERQIAAYEAARRDGRGTAYVDGEFIAIDIAAMAERVLARSRQAAGSA
ncbi:MAG: CoA ester lyase [Hyphomicrobiaceae bacterium]|nr:CoA ester lyase [Hyphomicrobiaceae bacterium]